MKKHLLKLEFDGENFLVISDPALAAFKRERPEMLHAITMALIDFAVSFARWNKDRHPDKSFNVIIDGESGVALRGIPGSLAPGGPA
ncbi:MAG: hypothetical protein HS101_15985 [Planctomycetia bacterium]|nr:hypothetical protein [Planctomycetia bacterium]MCC7315153.1 hypothetical protein [Planctomycetota bacterium]OQY96254.1 MAG: hypothetical protein B6D36_19720 [Planctomycetes bacterium UTPLA1]